MSRVFERTDPVGDGFTHGRGDESQGALYEADGGAWKLTAIQRIAEWIKDKLPEVAVIA